MAREPAETVPRAARYPAIVEIQYRRALLELMNAWRETALRRLGEEGALLLASAAAVRTDAEEPTPTGWVAVLERMLNGINSGMIEALSRATGQLELLARRVDKVGKDEWRAQVRQAWGVDPLRSEPWLRDELSAWEQRNLGLIKSLPQQATDKLRGRVQDAVRDGQSVRQLRKAIQEETGAGRKRAQLIAADQIGKLVGNLAERRQRQAGLKEYIWSTSRDERVRATHRAREGKKYRWNAPGIKPGQEIRCFPGSTRFNLLNGCQKVFRHRYRGHLTELVAEDGTVLEATLNHPVLTGKGWLPVNVLQVGDYLVQPRSYAFSSAETDPDQLEARAADLFAALEAAVGRSETLGSVANFHGDGAEGQVDIVDVEGFLGRYGVAAFAQRLRELDLTWPNEFSAASRFVSGGEGAASLQRERFTADGGVGGGNTGETLLGGAYLCSGNIGLAASALGDAVRGQDLVETVVVNPVLSGQGRQPFPSGISRGDFGFWQRESIVRWPVFSGVGVDAPGAELLADGAFAAAEFGRDGFQVNSCEYQLLRLVEKRSRVFDGHVYNLQTASGWYGANSLVVHNCRCNARPVFPPLEKVLSANKIA